MSLQYRPLGIVKEMLDQIGIEVTYAYEDLVFIKHNHVLLQFGKTGEILFFYANVESSETDAQQLFTAIQNAATTQGITLIHRGRYQLSAGEGENLSLEFLDDAIPEQ
jgi:hypothetical protein